MTIVIDASVVVAALIDSGADGAWGEEMLASGDLAAPHLMPARPPISCGALRCPARSRTMSRRWRTPISWPCASACFAYEPFAERVWELRGTTTGHDAWYVALAEALDAPLATLDRKLGRASGLSCAIDTPSQ